MSESFSAIAVLPSRSRGRRDDRRQLVERHPGLDLLVPAAGADVDHQSVRALELSVHLVAARTFRAARALHRGVGGLEVADLEADVVDAAGGGALADVG